MELSNEFSVKVPLAEAWSVLTDVERIAPCMPGAELQEVEGEEYRGVVKVKVGPITAQYKGKAVFVERDEQARRLVLRADGRDTRGQGNANATITATLEPDGEATSVRVVTDLTVTGKVAQFGRGVLADVSTKLLDQFVACLERDLLSGEASESAAGANGAGGPASPEGARASAHDGPTDGGAGTETSTVAPAAPTVPRREVEPVDLLDAAGVPVLKRVAPVVAGLFGVLWVLRRRRRRRR